MSMKRSLSAALLLLACGPLHAGEVEDLTQLRDTTLNLIRALVDQGVLSKAKADALIKQAQRSAGTSGKTAAAVPSTPDNIVHVPYVPELVRNQIRDEVKKDVLAQAKTERWGDPGTLPDWLGRIKWSGDVRARAQLDNFASGNDTFIPNYMAINQAGDIGKTGTPYLNTSVDRRRWLLRARLGMEAAVSDNVMVRARLSSGTTSNPVSSNSTMGSYENRSAIVLDQAFIRYEPRKWLQVQAGKMPNPWLSTDLVWDDDLNFDGLAATYTRNHGGLSGFVTAGAFPVQEVDYSANDKWLYAGQVGVDYQDAKAHRARLGLAYYGYTKMAGVTNQPSSHLQDFTAPVFFQKGNTYFNISNDPLKPDMWALASDYKLIDITGIFDVANFGRTRVTLAGEYVKNIGFDKSKILQRSSLVVGNRDQGYMGKLTVGMPEVKERNEWQVFGAYRYLEGDAVPDAFTDSDFHLGGTNAKGWLIGGNYGLAHNTWLTLRYMAADEIDGPPLGIDVLQLDLNTRF
jgi:hypothetical protein